MKTPYEVVSDHLDHNNELPKTKKLNASLIYDYLADDRELTGEVFCEFSSLPGSKRSARSLEDIRELTLQIMASSYYSMSSNYDINSNCDVKVKESFLALIERLRDWVYEASNERLGEEFEKSACMVKSHNELFDLNN